MSEKIFEKRYGDWEIFGLKGGLVNSMGPGKFFLKGGGKAEKEGAFKKGGPGHPTGTMGHVYRNFLAQSAKMGHSISVLL